MNPALWEMNNGSCSLHAGQACKFDSQSLIPSLLKIHQISLISAMEIVQVVNEVLVNLDNELLVDAGT